MERVILFDGVCNLCNSWVNFVIDRDPDSRFRFAALQSEFGKEKISSFGKDPAVMDSVILVKGDKIYIKSRAALEIIRELRSPLSLLYVFVIVPGFIRNFVYDIIANNRYRWFGRTDECRIPEKGIEKRFI